MRKIETTELRAVAAGGVNALKLVRDDSGSIKGLLLGIDDWKITFTAGKVFPVFEKGEGDGYFKFDLNQFFGFLKAWKDFFNPETGGFITFGK